MTSKLQIWNLALANIQQSPSIQGVNEDSTAANFCRVYYDDMLKMALQRHDWNFASKSVTLAEVTANPPDEWAYQYGYPADCLQFREIVKPRQAFPEIPFVVNVNPDDGLIGSQDIKVILSNWPEAKGRYTYNQKDTTFFSEAFSIYLSWSLSTQIAMPMTNKRSTKIAAGEEAERVLLIAKASDMNEERRSKEDRKQNSFTDAHL